MSVSQLDLIRTPKVDNVKLVHPTNVKGAHGTLHLTTTHIIFVNLQEGKETWILYGHIAEAEKLPLSARGSSIRLRTRTFLNATLIITRERDCSDVFDTIVQFSNPNKYEDLYAFHYNPSEEELSQDAGWGIYDCLAEYKRMEVPKELWLPTKLNKDYKLCNTYPNKFFLPASVTNETVYACARFRSKNRLPVLSYYHKSTQTSICRCAQPLAGFNSRCTEDEQMVQAMIRSTPGSNRMYIVDTRPKINAMANRAAGKGYENVAHYDNVDFQFIGIENIHAMRSSLKRLLEVFELKEFSHSAYLQGLEDSSWLKHIKSVMDTSAFIAKAVSYEKRTVIVHCSDGWDRTAQTCSLASLLLDPYYRTIHGFQILIEKEWLSFGHKFTDRCGMLSGDAKETSPVFTQFLESVWQLSNQYPTAFEFNEEFLIEIHDHLYSHQFGTFIGNNERERFLLKLSERTYSLWGSMWQNLKHFINPFYETTHGVLVPLTTQRHFKVWINLYNRHNIEVHPREATTNFIGSLSDSNVSLRDHIRYMEERISKLTNLSSTSNLNNDDIEIINELDSLEVKNNADCKQIKYSQERKDGINITDTSDGFERLESVTALTQDIPSYSLEWESLLLFTSCSCGRKIDPLTRITHCWNCGCKSCSSCVNRSIKIPGHHSDAPYPVCRTCYKKLSN